MTVYCRVDFHARQQTICYCDTTDGAVQLAELDHQADDVRGFYSTFTGEVLIGLEASGYSTWFVELLEWLGHRALVGDASEIRRLAKRRRLCCENYFQARKLFECILLYHYFEQRTDKLCPPLYIASA